MAMRIRGCAAAVAAMTLLIADPAIAKEPTSEDYSDARCFLVFTILPERLVDGAPVSQEQRAAMDTVASYYLGKIAGRSPTLDLASVMTPAIISDVQSNLSAHLEGCASGPDTLMETMLRVGLLFDEATKLR